MSLLHRLVLLVILAMAPAAAIQLYDVRELRGQREEEVHRQAERMLDLIEAEQIRLIDGIRQTLVTIRQAEAVRGGEAAACQDFMDRLRPDYPKHIILYVADRQGTIRCGTDRLGVGAEVGRRPHIREALATEDFVVGEFARGGRSGRAWLPFALRFRDATGEVAGVVTAMLDLAWLGDFLATKTLPFGGAAIMADRGGIVLARVPRQPDLVGQPLPDRYRPLVTADEQGMADSLPSIVAYSPISSDPKGLFVAVELDQTAATTPIDAAARRALGLFALGLLVLLVMVLLGGEFLLRRPVAGLVAVTRRWRQGERSVRSGLHGGSEIAALGRAFDDLAADLDEQTRQRELAERELRRSSDLLDRIMEHLPVGVLVMGADGRVVRVNAAAGRIWGGSGLASLDDYSHRKGWWADSGEPIEAREWAAARALRDGTTSLGEIVDIEGFDGQRKTIRSSAAPIRGEDGSLLGAVVVNEDITGQRVAERRLQENFILLDTIIESSPDPIFIQDTRGRYVVANSATAFLHGTGRDQLTGPAAPDLPALAAGAAWPQPGSRIMEPGRPEISEEVIHSEGHGGPRHFLSTRIPLRDAGGRLVGTIGLLRDITALKQAETALRDSEKWYRGLVETQTDLILRFDGAGRFTFANDKACQAFGLRREDLLDASWTSFIHPDDLDVARAGLEQARTAADHRGTIESRVRLAEGVRWFSWEGSAVVVDGRIVEMQVVGRDIHQRKTMEDELRRAMEAAEEANLAKSKFLAAASHDLRQPLQSLFLFSAALAPHVRGERGQSTLTLLERGLDTLKALLDSLLDVSRLDAGVTQPQVTDVPLAPILEDVGAAFQPIAQAKGLTLAMEPSCRVTVRTDPTLLGRMVRNLVENAIRYTERGGVRIGCGIADGAARVTVTDTGIGIPGDQLERIFEEFHQVGNSERDRSQGLGLGLAIVRRLSRLLGHPVGVRSQAGRGTSFTIDVPLGRDGEGAASVPPEEAAAPAGRGRLALVIDDDTMVLSGLRVVLEGWDYQVLLAGSGSEAVERLREAGRVPDVVIADYRLREGEVGPQAIDRVRNFLGRPVPGVILTGETGLDYQREATRHGLGLAHKPVTPRQLRGVLERQLGTVE